MKIFPLYSESMASNSYILTDDAVENAVVIDPSLSYRESVLSLPQIPRFSAILLTHAHFDHMLSLAEWREKTQAPLMVGRGDQSAVTNGNENLFAVFYGYAPHTAPAERVLQEGDTVSFGEEVLTVLETPGHTKGGLTFAAEGALYVGDTLFSDGGYGRTDFPGGSLTALIGSINRLLLLDEGLTIYAGHGEKTTVQAEKTKNSLYTAG